MANPSKDPVSPRKSPRQSRSRALVDAILEATTRILPEGGLDKTTTNRIAQVAGVSIGSLYQYFPNKDAIVAGLIERDLKEQQRVYRQMIDDMREAPLEQVVNAIVDHATDRYLTHPRLARAAFIHAPRLQHLDTILELRRSVGEALADLFRTRDDVQIDNPEQAAFTLVNAVMGVYQTWVVSPETERMPTEAVNRHLGRLILGYLASE